MRQDCPEDAAGPNRGWLDDLPRHWSVERVSNRARMSIGWTPPTSDDSNFDGENLWANISDLGERYVGDTAKRVSDEAVRVARAHPAPAGSLLFSFKLSVGAVSFPTVPMYTNEAIAAFTPRRELDMRYAYYAFPIYILRNAGENIYGAPILNQTRLAQAKVAFPPLDEQRAIADHLDRETAQIDAFIAKNEELIALLTERRTAAIARTVTGRRSGDSDDQDPDWMQRLPSDWKLLPVKLLAKRVTDGAHISPETEGGEYDFVSTRDVSAGSIDYEGSLKTSPQTYSYMVRTGCQPRVGDVLYSKDGTIGETAVVRESRDFVVASSLIIITPDPSLVVSDYLRYALSSVPLLEQAKTLVRGAGLPRLSIANLATVRVPLPPLGVQRELVDWLDQVTRSIDSAIGVARRSVQLARERRAALISAAVTGRIDVGVAV